MFTLKKKIAKIEKQIVTAKSFVIFMNFYEFKFRNNPTIFSVPKSILSLLKSIFFTIVEST